MFTWSGILLALLKLANTIMGNVQQNKWVNAGRAEAERDEAQAGRAAAEAEAKAAIDAPQTADDAIRRLGEGSA